MLDRIANRNHNQLSWLSGVPNSVRTLSVAHNLYVLCGFVPVNIALTSCLVLGKTDRCHFI